MQVKLCELRKGRRRTNPVGRELSTADFADRPHVAWIDCSNRECSLKRWHSGQTRSVQIEDRFPPFAARPFRAATRLADRLELEW